MNGGLGNHCRVFVWCSWLVAPTREREGSPMESTTLQQDPVTPAPSQSARLGRYDRPRHGRQQSDDLPHHRAVRRSGSDPRAGQRRRPAAHRRRAARLGRGAGLDRTGPDVAEPRRRHLGGVRRSVPALQSGARGADRHLLLVGLGADLRLDRAPVGARPSSSGTSPGCRSKPSPSASSASSAFVNLCGIHWVARLAIPIATMSAALAFVSALAPDLFGGDVDWHQAFDFHLTTPFYGWFGDRHLGHGRPLSDRLSPRRPSRPPPATSARPSIQTATCRAPCLPSRAMAGLYFIVLPVVWLGVLGPEPLGKDLATVLGPTFAPLFGSFGKAAAIWFIMFNMFHGTLQPLAGAARTCRSSPTTDCCRASSRWRIARPTVPGSRRAHRGMRNHLPVAGDPVWMIAAANFTYLIGICMPSVAVWLLRRDHAGRRATVSRAARHHHAWRGRRIDLAALGHPRLPAVRPPDGHVRPGPRLLRGGALRLARHRGPQAAGPARRRAARCT